MKLLIYESAGDWAAALRREFSPPASIVELRNFDDLSGELTNWLAAVVVIEVAGDQIEPSAGAIEKMARLFPDAVLLAVADHNLRNCEAILREAGAVHVVFSTRNVAEIAAIARRHLAAETPNDFNAGGSSFEEQVFERLAWG